MKESLSNKNLVRTVAYLLYLVAVWTYFRYNVKLPDVVTELWFKPVLWLIPVFWLNIFSGRQVKFFDNKLRGLVWGIGLGLIYSLFLVFYLGIRRWSLNWNGVGIGLVTAVTENLVFAGYVLPRYLEVFTEKKALILTGLNYAVIHLPIVVLVMKPSLASVVGLFMLSVSIGIVNGWVRLRSGSAIAPITASWLWNAVSLM